MDGGGVQVGPPEMPGMNQPSTISRKVKICISILLYAAVRCASMYIRGYTSHVFLLLPTLLLLPVVAAAAVLLLAAAAAAVLQHCSCCCSSLCAGWRNCLCGLLHLINTSCF